MQFAWIRSEAKGFSGETNFFLHLKSNIDWEALIKPRMNYGAFLFHKLEKTQLQKLEKIQCRAIRGARVYRNSTPTNIMLAEDE